jgi:hypothetical protein
MKEASRAGNDEAVRGGVRGRFGSSCRPKNKTGTFDQLQFQ